MLSSISGALSAYSAAPAAAAAQPKTAAPQKPAEAGQDTVHLSSAALARSGDVDHDGDSH